MSTLSIIVLHDADPTKSEKFITINQKILRSSLPKNAYEIIYLGYRASGFSHITLYKSDPLVRAFYDGVLNRAQRINAAVQEAHCETILIWPGLYFLKSDFKPIPEDVVSPEYYLMLYMRMYGIKQVDPKWPGFEPFGVQKFHYNFNDTIRFFYKLNDLSWRNIFWFLGCLLRSIGR